MKILRNLLGILLCCTVVFMLASCSNATKSYSDKINDAYQAGNAVLYEDAVKALGDECIDCTKSQTGILVAAKGIKKDNYLEQLEKADQNTKFDIITVTVVQGKCTYSHFSTGTVGDIRASLMNGQNI